MKYLGVYTDGMPPEVVAEIQSMIDGSMTSMDQLVINQTVTEGQTVILPTTNQDITLNLATGGASLV